MLRIKNTEVYGIERSLVSSGNSFKTGEVDTNRSPIERDWKRGKTLGKAEMGMGHDGYLKGITVYADFVYPNYWTPEAQRYSHFNIIMSSSKMHCLCKNASFSFEKFKAQFNKYVDEDLIKRIQEYARLYNKEEDVLKKYEYFMKMQSNLPMGYELTMTVVTNYLQLKTMFNQRKNHRLREDWVEGFCKWCISLPHFSELTGCALES